MDFKSSWLKNLLLYILVDCRMSAIGFYCTVEKVKGNDGEDRVVVIFNGKYLPHTVQVKTPTISFDETLFGAYVYLWCFYSFQESEDNVARLQKL